ncbi:MAG: FG-GAP repeat domain-containing protein, partial [Planctomycetota bacterium]
AGADGDFFQPPWPFGSGFNNAPPFLIADMTADGVNDIAANMTGSAFTPDTVWVWRNDGNGFFTRVISYEGMLVLAAANFDGDAYGDLILGSSSAYFLRRGGPNGYESAVQIGTRFRASIPVVGDLNGDSYPDLFGIQGSASGLGDSDPTIFYGGPTAFADVEVIEGVVLESASGSTPFSLFSGDIDGDGLGDLAINATGGSKWGLGAWTALQDDQGGFAFVRQYLDLQQLADLDGDGDLDVVGDLKVSNLTENGSSAGSRQQYGLPSAGSDGLAPTLGATGPFRPGETLELHFSGGLGGAPGVYWIGGGSSHQSLAGLNINIWPLRTSRPVILDGEPAEAGGGNAVRSHALPVDLAGTDLFVQAFFLDPMGPLGISASNGLQLSIGQ